MKRLALFDCDGTLVDGQAAVCLAMERCFTAEGLTPPPRSASRRIVGLSLYEAMRALLPEGDATRHERLAEGYKVEFRAMRGEALVQEPLFDGILEALDQLEQDGWLLGVATGKSDRGLNLCLTQHGIAGRFVSLQTADRHPSKPHPAMAEAAMAEAGVTPAQTAMIGDTSYDMLMARAAGARAIGVAWGYHAPDELRAAGAEAIAENPQELPILLERLA